MTATELQAIRKLLFFSVPEAALLVAASPERPGGVSERAWRQWESGERPVPEDVTLKLRELCDWRESALAAAIDQVKTMASAHGEPTELVMVWYGRLQDWTSIKGRDPVLWRPQCSVLAQLASTYDFIILKLFDPEEYEPWRGHRTDSETLRSEWAAMSVASDSSRGSVH